MRATPLLALLAVCLPPSAAADHRNPAWDCGNLDTLLSPQDLSAGTVCYDLYVNWELREHPSNYTCIVHYGLWLYGADPTPEPLVHDGGNQHVPPLIWHDAVCVRWDLPVQ